MISNSIAVRDYDEPAKVVAEMPSSSVDSHFELPLLFWGILSSRSRSAALSSRKLFNYPLLDNFWVEARLLGRPKRARAISKLTRVLPFSRKNVLASSQWNWELFLHYLTERTKGDSTERPNVVSCPLWTKIRLLITFAAPHSINKSPCDFISSSSLGWSKILHSSCELSPSNPRGKCQTVSLWRRKRFCQEGAPFLSDWSRKGGQFQTGSNLVEFPIRELVDSERDMPIDMRIC